MKSVLEELNQFAVDTRQVYGGVEEKVSDGRGYDRDGSIVATCDYIDSDTGCYTVRKASNGEAMFSSC